MRERGPAPVTLHTNSQHHSFGNASGSTELSRVGTNDTGRPDNVRHRGDPQFICGIIIPIIRVRYGSPFGICQVYVQNVTPGHSNHGLNCY